MRLFRTRSAASDRDDGSPVEEGRLDSLTEGVGPLQAIDRLTEANRIDPEPGIERRLVEIRHHAFADLKDRKSVV